MDKRPDLVENFEEIIKQHTVKKPTRLYSNSKGGNTTGFQSRIDYNPKDIIRNISAQIKAIQNADCVTSKSVNKVLEKYKTSSFVPVNKLQASVVPQTKAAKFETQFVLDTQLMNVIEDVEAMSSHKGITQEFDSTFDHNVDLINTGLELPDDKVDNASTDTKSSSSVGFIVSPEKTVNIIEDSKAKHNINKDSKEFHPITDISEVNDIKTISEYELSSNKPLMDDRCTALLDRCIEIEENVDIQYLITDSNINLSPIIDINKVNKSNSGSPLVYNLDSFEKFEKIVLPIFKDNNNIDRVKHLINSQIIGKELFLRSEFEPESSTREESLSPVLKITKISKTNAHNNLTIPSTSNKNLSKLKRKLQCNIEDRCKSEENILELSPNNKLDILGNTLENFNEGILKESATKQENKSLSYEDEILFSSDEENDIKETNIQDLPFTCALETSFYEHSDVLDSTMYVGFQTASNKSIQVSTVSFTKAKSLLDDEIDSNVKVPTLKELVEKCDTSKSKITFIDGNRGSNVDTYKNSESQAEEMQNDLKIDTTNVPDFVGFKTANGKVIKISEKVMDKAKSLFEDIENDTASKNSFGGFKTASNKNINLSEKALQRCKRVFQDIDLDEDFCDDNMSHKNEPCNKRIRHSLEDDKAVTDDIINISEKETCHLDIPKIDEDILQEFEGEIMTFNDIKEDGVNQLIGFKTASNKNIAISDNALEKSKKIFDDLYFAETSNTKIKHDNEKLNKDHNLTSKYINVSPKTGSNKTINISDKALARDKTVFEDIDIYDLENSSSCAIASTNIVINEENVKNDKNYRTTSVITDSNFVGLKTASNKMITISDNAIIKSKNIFHDIEHDVHENCKTENDFDDQTIKVTVINDFTRSSTSKQNFVEFRTANNKKITISETAFEKTKNMFQDLDYVQPESSNNFTEELDIVKDRQLTEEFDEDFKVSSEINIVTDIHKPVMNIEESTDNKLIDGNNKFKGFSTAGYRPITISNEAFTKTKLVFQDILNEKTETDKTNFEGFQTASNKKIQISDVALAKSRKIFEDLDKVNDKSAYEEFNADSNRKVKKIREPFPKSKMICDNLDKDNEVLNEIQSSPVFKGYQTASNKSVKISSAALARSRKIFDEIDVDDKELDEVEKKDKAPVFNGFQTASSKKIIISDQALANSRKIFEEIDVDDKELDEVEKKDKASVFKGFQTASNKKVIISDQALANSRKIFEDLYNDNEKVSRDDNTKTAVFKGFQTASNKEVLISDHALAKSRKVFEDFDKQSEVVEKDSETSVSKGFRTASNKQVKISAAALAKSRKMFEDLDTVVENTPIFEGIKSKSDVQSLKQKDEDTSNFVGFQTANNKNVKISTAALEKSKKIFQDIDVARESDFFEKNITKPFSGFQTPKNQEVKVSIEALAKSKTIFEGKEKENEGAVNLEQLNPDKHHRFSLAFKGFSTASNKEVKVSADALAMSKKILQDINEFRENETRGLENNEEMTVIGFQTASNQKVVISEEALAKSRQILSDIKVNENSKSSFGFKTANNNNIKISEDARIKSRKIFTEINEEVVIPNSCVIKLKTDKYTKTKSDINIDKLIDTQVIKNFDESLDTEDFRSPENRPKRSGSPILSCPRAKKRKFATPYKKCNQQDLNKPLDEETEIYDNNYKKHKKYTLKDIANLENTNTNSEIKTDLDKININLENFEFTDKGNDISDSTISLEEFKVIFLKSVNKKLVPDGWYENHIKLIIWKLLSYELKFPKTMSGVCTAKNALLQLKYRYFKELYSAERPALRRILERDDVASKMLVLCVMDIYNGGGEISATYQPELLLTDGWYSIRTCIDRMLAKHVNDGKIKIGMKIVTHGAELVNCEQGVAPWEDTSSVRLKIFGNSTRRARWDARLGYHGCRGGIISHLAGLKPEGGKVSTLRVLVTRVYPPLYVEKFEDGSTVTRSERLEHIHQMKYESDRQALVEKIYEEVEKEMSDEESLDTEDIDDSKRSLDSGSQIARLMKMSKEPSQFRANLTDSQRRLLESYTSSKRDKLLQDIEERIRSKLTVMTRNVVPLLKIRVAEVHNGRIDKALLSIWKPNDALSELITEGAYIEILNVVPTAVRYSELQLSAGRQTIFKQMKKIPENLIPYIKALNRTCYPIKEIVTHPNMVTDYNEIDTIGMVIQIDPSNQDFKNVNQFQNVFLTDEEKNIICVNFWGGIKKFGFENVLDTGQIVACVNLQKRVGNTRKCIPQYRATEFTYFTKTPKSTVARKLVEELSKNIVKNKGFIEECLVVKNNLLKSHISNEISPYRFQNHDLAKNKIYIESPLARIQPKILDEFNLSGLDFESTFRQTEPQELSPKSLLRKKRVHEKISKLKMYGEPPPLSPINIINKSKNATKSFKSPLLNPSAASKCDTPVANMKILPKNKGENELNSSPVLGLNRALKKSVNPVKLDFNNVAIEENDSVDHFAEEFDASPPLSLD